jgi:hypothetical protein
LRLRKAVNNGDTRIVTRVFSSSGGGSVGGSDVFTMRKKEIG